MPTTTAIIARTPIAIRTATMADLPFMDGLQKKHNKALGYFPTKQFEGYVATGGVLVAEATGLPTADLRLPNELNVNCKSPLENRQCLGYIISRDRYLKRDELGVIYQLCVVPGFQRGLIGASLVKAVFERSAYGCRLYCCWCAQDLAANYFWESLGFVPIAFRAGSTGKKRVHIFWQRRIDPEQSQFGNRQSAISWWYPFKTDNGAIREDRLVFPIPPGTHWKDVKPLVLPGNSAESRMLSAGEKPKPAFTEHSPRGTQHIPAAPPAPRAAITRSSALRFAPPSPPALPAPPAPVKPQEKLRHKKPTATACPERNQRIDPKYLAAARELRDRYLERVNEDPLALASYCKYDVSRTLCAAEVSRALGAPMASPLISPARSLPRNPLPQTARRGVAWPAVGQPGASPAAGAGRAGA